MILLGCFSFVVLTRVFFVFSGYLDIGDPNYVCSHCSAIFWYDERLRKSVKAKNPRYSVCCVNGKIQLAKFVDPPRLLRELFFGGNTKSKHYQQNIRSYNSMFGFTSMGGKIDSSINVGQGPSIFRLHGQNYHLIGSMMPLKDCRPKFAQLYIYDTENEVNNRISAVRYVFFLSILFFLHD